MPEPLTSNDLIRAAEFTAVMEHAASREPLTDAVLAEITDRLLEVVPGSHWLSVHSLLAELRRLKEVERSAEFVAGMGNPFGIAEGNYQLGYAAGLEAAAKLLREMTAGEGSSWAKAALLEAEAEIRKLGVEHAELDKG